MSPDKVETMPCARFRPVWLQKPSSEYREIYIYIDARRHWRARLAAVTPTCLNSKLQLEQWRHLAWRVRCSAFCSGCMKCDPSDHHKVIQNHFFAWCEVGVCLARCCALSLALAPGSSHKGLGRVDSTQASQLKLPGKGPKPGQTPLIPS
jgi:hypothetical protein